MSDLGATSCATFTVNFGRYACTPAHQSTNMAFAALGVTTIAGALLLRTHINQGPIGLTSTALLITTGIGISMAGLNPKNLDIARHELGDSFIHAPPILQLSQ